MRTSEVDAHFESVVAASARSLFATAYLLTGNAHDAEELLQDVLVRLLPKWEKVMAAQSAQAYVRRSLINRFISQQRSSLRTVSWSFFDSDDTAGDPTVGVLDKDVLRGLLLALPPKQRAAIVLRFLDDATDVDISQVLGCRVSTVRSLVSRGLAAMRQQAVAAEHPYDDEGVVHR